jgi:hypothetical protein
MGQHVAHTLRRTARIAPVEPGKRQPLQSSGRGLVAGDLAGIFMAQLVQRKVQLRGEGLGACDRGLIPGKEAAHLGPRAQALFGIGQGVPAEGLDRHPKPDCAEDIGEAAAMCAVQDRAGGGQRWQAEPVRAP